MWWANGKGLISLLCLKLKHQLTDKKRELNKGRRGVSAARRRLSGSDSQLQAWGDGGGVLKKHLDQLGKGEGRVSELESEKSERAETLWEYGFCRVS